MKALPGSIIVLACLGASAFAVESPAELERRAAEQERQIRQLEVQNQQLREQIDLLQEKLLAYEKPAVKPEAQPPAETPAPPSEPEAAVHVVRAGESLSKIARLHGTTTTALAKLNGLRDPGMIREGQRLKLPAKDTPASASASPAGTVEGTHRVKSGETFYTIAGKYGLSVEALQAANPGVNPKALQVGQELKLSATKAPAAPEPATAEEGAPTSGREESAPATASRPVIRSVPIDNNISFGEFARQHQMDPAKLNALNGLQLEPQTVLATGSRLYVSAQPLE